MFCKLSLKAIQQINEFLPQMKILRNNSHLDIHISKVFLIFIVSSSILPSILNPKRVVLTLPSPGDSTNVYSNFRLAESVTHDQTHGRGRTDN